MNGASVLMRRCMFAQVTALSVLQLQCVRTHVFCCVACGTHAQPHCVAHVLVTAMRLQQQQQQQQAGAVQAAAETQTAATATSIPPDLDAIAVCYQSCHFAWFVHVLS